MVTLYDRLRRVRCVILEHISVWAKASPCLRAVTGSTRGLLLWIPERWNSKTKWRRSSFSWAHLLQSRALCFVLTSLFLWCCVISLTWSIHAPLWHHKGWFPGLWISWKGGKQAKNGLFSFLGSWQVVDVVEGVSAAYKPFNNRAEACWIN